MLNDEEPKGVNTRHGRIRLENLEILISEAGSAARLARLANTSASYLSQVRHQLITQKGTARSVGDALANKLEQAMGKPQGWMDAPQDYVEEPETGAEYSTDKSPPDLRVLHPLISWVQAGKWGDLAARLALPSAETLNSSARCISSIARTSAPTEQTDAMSRYRSEYTARCCARYGRRWANSISMLVEYSPTRIAGPTFSDSRSVPDRDSVQLRR